MYPFMYTNTVPILVAYVTSKSTEAHATGGDARGAVATQYPPDPCGVHHVLLGKMNPRLPNRFAARPPEVFRSLLQQASLARTSCLGA